MSDAPITPGRPPNEVACPECGVRFSRRGISSHRRLRHGVVPPAVTELGETLTRIAEVLERLEARLEPETAPKGTAKTPSATDPIEPPPALPSPPSARATELSILERGLREVMSEIARVKRETERQLAVWGARAPADERKALEKTTYQVLGNLRRRQASLLFRLQEARGEDAIDNSLCL